MQSSNIQEVGGVDKQRNFVRAMWKSIDGRSLNHSERDLLDAIFQALLRGEDVSGLIGIKPAHTRRSADPIHVALHYLCLTKLMRATPVEAWRIVGEAWTLRKREVQWVIADNWAPALAMLQQLGANPDTLIRLCEQRAGAGRRERPGSGSAPAMPGNGGTLDAR